LQKRGANLQTQHLDRETSDPRNGNCEAKEWDGTRCAPAARIGPPKVVSRYEAPGHEAQRNGEPEEKSHIHDRLRCWDADPGSVIAVISGLPASSPVIGHRHPMRRASSRLPAPCKARSGWSRRASCSGQGHPPHCRGPVVCRGPRESSPSHSCIGLLLIRTLVTADKARCWCAYRHRSSVSACIRQEWGGCLKNAS
jgi:hypothetical protein